MAQDQPQAGLLGEILQKGPLSGLGITPQLAQRDIVVELSTQQLRDMLLANADERARSAVTVELHEGKLVLKIRLW